MGKVISFSKSIVRDHSSSHILKETQGEKGHTNIWTLFEEEEFFLKTTLGWPCFSELKEKTSSNELLTKYCNNSLSESQECVIDFLLHLHDDNFLFDLNFSLSQWSQDDRDFFISFLEDHSNSLD